MDAKELKFDYFYNVLLLDKESDVASIVVGIQMKEDIPELAAYIKNRVLGAMPPEDAEHMREDIQKVKEALIG